MLLISKLKIYCLNWKNSIKNHILWRFYIKKKCSWWWKYLEFHTKKISEHWTCELLKKYGRVVAIVNAVTVLLLQVKLMLLQLLLCFHCCCYLLLLLLWLLAIFFLLLVLLLMLLLVLVVLATTDLQTAEQNNRKHAKKYFKKSEHYLYGYPLWYS